MRVSSKFDKVKLPFLGHNSYNRSFASPSETGVLIFEMYRLSVTVINVVLPISHVVCKPEADI
jgi:hypothetical protein